MSERLKTMANVIDSFWGVWVGAEEVGDGIRFESIGTLLGDNQNTLKTGIFQNVQNAPPGFEDIECLLRLYECHHDGNLRVVVEDTRDEDVTYRHVLTLEGLCPYDWDSYPLKIDGETIAVLRFRDEIN